MTTTRPVALVTGASSGTGTAAALARGQGSEVMKAFVVGRYGSKDGLQMREMPEPGIGEHDVLVQVRAASVNLLDAKIRDGEFKLILPYRVPFVLGDDMAGVVLRVGSAVRSFAPGDEVYARPGTDTIGTFAELAAVHEDDLALKPATLTMEEAAALPLVALTAWQALVERANLQPGQKILVHAGSGGVGTIAIQLARHLGAHVATTGTANIEWVKNLGADVVIDYKRDRRPRRRRHDQAGHRPGLPLRVDQGRHGLRRERAGQGQGRRHDG